MSQIRLDVIKAELDILIKKVDGLAARTACKLCSGRKIKGAHPEMEMIFARSFMTRELQMAGFIFVA